MVEISFHAKQSLRIIVSKKKEGISHAKEGHAHLPTIQTDNFGGKQHHADVPKRDGSEEQTPLNGRRVPG